MSRGRLLALDSQYELGRQYLGYLAYPPHASADPDRQRRERFVRALRYRMARRLPLKRVPEELRHPPLDEEIDGPAEKGRRRYVHAITGAWGVLAASGRRAADPADWEKGTPTYAAMRLAEMLAAARTGVEGESGTPEHVLRRWKKWRRVVHLALPLLRLELLLPDPDLLAKEFPNLAAAFPDLVAPIPSSFAELEVDARWPGLALVAASHWRDLLPELGLKIERSELFDLEYFDITILGNSRQ